MARPELPRADEIKASFDYPGSAWLARTFYPALQGGGTLLGGAAADLVAVAGTGVKSLAWAARAWRSARR